MRRRLVNLATSVSLFVFLLLTTLCVRSQWLEQWVHLNFNRNTRLTVTTLPSGLHITFLRSDWPLARMQIGRTPYSKIGYRPQSFFWPAYWFRDDARPTGPRLHKIRALKLPWWLILPPTAALPIAWLRRRRHTAGGFHGLCPNCGYDLRATPLRCPECGAVPAVK